MDTGSHVPRDLICCYKTYERPLAAGPCQCQTLKTGWTTPELHLNYTYPLPLVQLFWSLPSRLKRRKIMENKLKNSVILWKHIFPRTKSVLCIVSSSSSHLCLTQLPPSPCHSLPWCHPGLAPEDGCVPCEQLGLDAISCLPTVSLQDRHQSRGCRPNDAVLTEPVIGDLPCCPPVRKSKAADRENSRLFINLSSCKCKGFWEFRLCT